MGRFRDIKRAKLRPTVHKMMADDALCFATPITLTTEAVPLTVRVHDKFHAQGDLKGTNFNYVEMEDDSPYAIFWYEELVTQGLTLTTLEKKILTFEPGRVYKVGAVKPRDDQTVTAQLSIVQDVDTEGFPYP